MQFQPGDIFHVYNRGNNKQQIFFSDDNYLLFQKKISDHIVSVCDVLAYCLMPNHFHFLIRANEFSCKPKVVGSLTSTELTNGFRVLQSSYAAAINKANRSTGSLFQQKSKFKLLFSSADSKHDYLQCCFHYIHQNPLRAGLVTKLEDWKYSSFNEYLSDDSNGVCNKPLAKTMLDIPAHLFYDLSYSLLNEDILFKIKSL